MNYGIRKSFLNIEKSSYATEDSFPESLDNYIDCSSGINPYGCSHKVKEALKGLKWEVVNEYPELSADIKESIADYWKNIATLNKKQIFLGDGSIGGIYKINRLFLGENSKVLGYSPQFTDFIDDVKSYGGKYDCYLLNKKNNYKFELASFIDKMNGSHDLFYIDNPNNPTGQVIDIESIQQIIIKAKSLSKTIIIDEAYGDFMPLQQSAISLINDYDNLFVLRTFSKGLGLAGLRAGYLVTSLSLGKYYKLVANPYEMNGIARELAICAMQDTGFIKSCNESIKIAKKKLIESLTIFRPLETDLNVPIMIIKHPNSQVDLKQLLKEYGILAISGEGFIGLNKSYVRIRMPKEIDKLIDRFKNIEAQISCE